jgi:hypothetical protein
MTLIIPTSTAAPALVPAVALEPIGAGSPLAARGQAESVAFYKPHGFPRTCTGAVGTIIDWLLHV